MTPIRWTALLIAICLISVVLIRVRPLFGADVIKVPSAGGATTQPAGPLDFVVKDIDGKEMNLADYKGKVVLIVNVASKCGFTKQYTALEALYKRHKDDGLVVIGFPANNFKGQEPGSNEEIKEFCSSKFSVTFPIMSKVSVKGDDKTPVYKFLTEPVTAGEFAGEIAWNFNKFLVDRNGKVMARFASATKPTDAPLVDAVETALKTR